MTNNSKYKDLFYLVDNEELKPKRDSSSGNFINSNGDVDLGLLRKFFPVSIECKNHKNFDFTLNSLLSNKIKMLLNVYFEQAVINADKVNLLPVVVFKANYTSIFCFWDLARFGLILADLKTKPYISLTNCLVITLFSDFLSIFNTHVKYKGIIN